MTQDGIILLHGIFRTHRSMRHMAKFFTKQGYRVLNLDYPSTRLSIEDLATHLHPTIRAFADEIPGQVHFIGYSLGGLVTRAYLHRYPLPNLGRVVMFGPPNHGSEVADFVQHWRWYRRLFGPAGQQLTTTFTQRDALFGPVNYALGIIAGRWTIDPISSLIIGKQNDGKVSVASTRLPGMRDHLVLRTPHTLFPLSKKAWRYALNFLKSSQFA